MNIRGRLAKLEAKVEKAGCPQCGWREGGPVNVWFNEEKEPPPACSRCGHGWLRARVQVVDAPLRDDGLEGTVSPGEES